jgi:hypothetical protein
MLKSQIIIRGIAISTIGELLQHGYQNNFPQEDVVTAQEAIHPAIGEMCR